MLDASVSLRPEYGGQQTCRDADHRDLKVAIVGRICVGGADLEGGGASNLTGADRGANVGRIP